jgi:DNA-binding transcriptional regulator YdaS (Cro superfamily)
MLKDMIERAEKAAGGQKQLGDIIGVNPSNIRNAKGGQCGLPTDACVMIAEMIGEDAVTVIAASELVTEKKERRRAFWEKKLEAIAAGILLSVISVMTPSPAQATTMLQVPDSTLYIMSNAV